MRRAILPLLYTGVAVGAFGGEIVLPSNPLERDAPVRAVFRAAAPVEGPGGISIEWRDAHGRLVEQRTIPVVRQAGREIAFTLDLRRASAISNRIHARLSAGGRRDEAEAAFLCPPPERGWWDYQVLMWQPGSTAAFRALATLGFTGGMYYGRETAPPGFLVENDMRWYVENIATDFYSAYHRYYPDQRPPGWAFDEARRLYPKDAWAAFERQPSLSDPAWLARIRERLTETARRWAPYRPVFYSLGDETGIAELAAFWDFDVSPQSLAAMRKWLAGRYGSLDALNREWGTAYRTWDAVMPMLTSEAMKRRDDNFAAWSDFKEWMDEAYARALRMGADAVHAVDPHAIVGIGGAQLPGWGGYDYARISTALDAIEAYDIGNNVDIARSLNPELALVTTSFASGPWEKWRVWHELLHGNRGLIVWDEKGEFADAEGRPGARGLEAAVTMREIRGGLGALLIAGRSAPGPVAIHYSQASLRTEWMLAQRPRGDDWVRRSASTEAIDNPFREARGAWCRAVEDAGFECRFVSAAQLEAGELARGGYRVLILPRSSAMSRGEAEAVRRFVQAGGLLLADGAVAAFDEHARRLPRPQLDDVFAAGAFGRGRAVRFEGGLHGAAARIGSAAQPEFVVEDAAGRAVAGVETRVFHNGAVRLVAVMNNAELRIGNLGTPEFPRGPAPAPRSLKLALAGEASVYDVRGGQALGRRREITVRLDPFEPAIFAVSEAPFPTLRVTAPRRIAPGQSGLVRCGFETATPARTHIFHIDVVAPDGHTVPYYSGNVPGPAGKAVWRIPWAWNDPPGTWTVRVRDVMSGQTAARSVEVR